jgi:transcriptional regulator with XRE-family HTH domain
MSRNKFTILGNYLGIGERIRKIRGELTQGEFAGRLGVQAPTISRYESGRIPDEEMLRKIADFGKTTIEWLLRGDQPSAPQLLGHTLEICGALPGPPLDVALLAEILEEIKQFISDKRLELSPRLEARLVALAYDHCQEDKVKPNRMLVERFLWITKVD